MSRWKKEEQGITKSAKTMRTWLETEKGEEYKERHRQYMKDWRAKNPEKKKASQKLSYRKARMEVLQHYSGKEIPECSCCQETQFEFLQIDHINNDGAEHRRAIGMAQGDANQVKKEKQRVSIGGNGFVYWLKKNNFPEGFQVLCANCHAGKTSLGTCPHKMIEEENYGNSTINV